MQPLPAVSAYSPGPLTRRELGWVLLLCGLVVSLFLGPALFTGRIFAPVDLLYAYQPWASRVPADWIRPSNIVLSDIVLQFVPLFTWAATRLHQGALPLWNPDNMLGAPFIGNMQSSVFDPLNWLFFLAPDPALLVARVWFKLFIAMLGMYVLARDTLRVRPLAASVAALVFPFCAFNTVWLQYPHSTVMAYLPWLWWTTARLMAGPSARRAAALGLVAGLSLLAGQPEMAYYAALATGLFALLTAWQAAPRQPRALAGRLVLWGVGYILGAGLAAVQIAPFLDYLVQSAALGLRGQAHSVDTGFPFHYFWTAFTPDLFGNHARDNWWDPVANYNEMNVYSGLLPWLLAPFALLARDGRQRRVALLLLALSVLALGTAYGWPFVRPFTRLLPLMQLGATGRLPVLWEFALALGGALGAEALLSRLPGSRRTVGLALALAVGMALVGIGYPMWTAVSVFWLPAATAAHTTWDAALGRTAVWLTLTAGMLVLALLVGRVRPRLTYPAWAVLVGLLAVDLWEAHGDYNPTVARADYYPSTRITDYLRAQPGLFRYAASGWILMPHTNMMYGLANLGGYDVLNPLSYYQAAVQIDPDLPGGGFTPFHHLSSPLLNVFNVRYLLVPPGEDPNYRPDVLQNASDRFTDELSRGHSAGQTFTATADNLTAVQVFGGTYRRRLRGTIVLHLKTDSAAPADVATAKLFGSQVGDAQWWTFTFPPIAASKGRKFYFSIEAQDMAPGAGFAVGYIANGPYPPGRRFVDDRPVGGDLAFRVLAQYTSGPPAFKAVVNGGMSGLSIYENTQVLPRAWLTHRVAVEPDMAARLTRLSDPAFDAAGTALLAAPLGADQPLPGAAPPSVDTVTIARYEPEVVDVQTTSGAAGVLILADQAFSGWGATVDDQPVSILTADHALRGVYLPAGSHTVRFRYRPLAFTLGAAVSGATIVLLVLMSFWPLRRKRSAG